MTYEEHLDEVTTLIFERFGLSEAAAIKLVMRAQADGYFSEHDDDPTLCTQLRAEQDAKRVFKQYSKPVDEAPAKSRRPGPPPASRTHNRFHRRAGRPPAASPASRSEHSRTGRDRSKGSAAG